MKRQLNKLEYGDDNCGANYLDDDECRLFKGLRYFTIVLLVLVCFASSF